MSTFLVGGKTEVAGGRGGESAESPPSSPSSSSIAFSLTDEDEGPLSRTEKKRRQPVGVLAFETRNAFASTLLFVVLFCCSFYLSLLTYFNTPMRQQIVVSLLKHTTQTPFKAGEVGVVPPGAGRATKQTAPPGSPPGLQVQVGPPDVLTQSFVSRIPGQCDIASGGVYAWEDVYLWLERVLAPTLYTGRVAAAMVVEEVYLIVSKGEVTSEDSNNVSKVVSAKWDYTEKTSLELSFAEALGRTYAVDISGEIQKLKDGNWLGALTISLDIYLQARDGQGNIGCVFLSFDQTPAGEVKTTYDVVTAHFASGAIPAFVISIMLLVLSIAYALVERKAYASIVAASKSALLTASALSYDAAKAVLFFCASKEAPTGRARECRPTSYYLQQRGFGLALVCCALPFSMLLLALLVLQTFSFEAWDVSCFQRVLSGMEFAVSLLAIAVCLLSALRAISSLAATSRLFKVFRRLVYQAANGFVGVFLVSFLLLLGAGACNFVAFGSQISEFGTFGSSLFQSFSILMGGPALQLQAVSASTAATLSSAFALLLWWTALAPALTAVVIHSFREALRGATSEEANTLGYDIVDQAKEWLASKCFLCTPDASKHGSLYTIVEGIKSEEPTEEKPVKSDAALHQKQEREAVAGDAGVADGNVAALASASRKQLAVLVPCVFIFAAAVCLIIDSPTQHREVKATLSEVLAPFASTDPFLDYAAAVQAATSSGTDAASAIEEVDVPEVWRLSHANCNSLPPKLPTTPPQVLRRPTTLLHVTSLVGLNDWFEQILFGSILNAARKAPTLANAIPLANPAVVLAIQRVQVECQHFPVLKEVYPVRRKRGVYANFTDSAFGKPLPSASTSGSDAAPPFVPVLGHKEYVVPIYFSGGGSPFTRDKGVMYPKDGSLFGRGVAKRLRETASSSKTDSSRRLSANEEAANGQLQGDNVQFTAADFTDLYVGQSSLRRKYGTLVSQKFLDWQLHALRASWLVYNGDSDVFMINSVMASISSVSLKVQVDVQPILCKWLHPLRKGFTADSALLLLSLLLLLVLLLLSYSHVKNGHTPSVAFGMLDVPLALTFTLIMLTQISVLSTNFVSGWMANELNDQSAFASRRLSELSLDRGELGIPVFDSTIKKTCFLRGSFGSVCGVASRGRPAGVAGHGFEERNVSNTLLLFAEPALAPVEAGASFSSWKKRQMGGSGGLKSRRLFKLATGETPRFSPGPVQPWAWLPGSSGSSTREEPPPTAASFARFSRIQSDLTHAAGKIEDFRLFAALFFCIASFSIGYTFRGMYRILENVRKDFLVLGAVVSVICCTLLGLAVVGYCILGSRYLGFKSFSRAVASVSMLATPKFNFNSILSEQQQGARLGPLLLIFSSVVSLLFFAFLNYLFLAVVFVRYDRVKGVEAKEMQVEIENKFGLQERKRVPLVVNDEVMLFFKAFLKALNLRAWGEDGNEDDLAALKDRFFTAIKEMPVLAQQPRTNQEYVRKSIATTQLVRIQQFLTDIEILRAKRYLLLHDLGVIAENLRVQRQADKRLGAYISGLERGIDEINKQIKECEKRRDFAEQYIHPDPMYAKQQQQQQQLLELQKPFQYQKYECVLLHRVRLFSEEDLHYLTAEQLAEHRKLLAARAAESMHWQLASSADVPRASVRERRSRRSKQEKSPLDQTPLLTTSVQSGGIKRRFSFSRFAAPGGVVPLSMEAEEEEGRLQESSSEDDWSLVRQKFGGERQGTLVLQGEDGQPLIVRPGREIPGVPLPTAAVRANRRPFLSTRAKANSEGSCRSSSSGGGQSPRPSSSEDQKIGTLAKTSSSSEAEEVDFRPASNAPAVAEERLRLDQQQQQSVPRLGKTHSRKRRATAEIPTFTQGGQEYRFLPRETKESRKRNASFLNAR